MEINAASIPLIKRRKKKKKITMRREGTASSGFVLIMSLYLALSCEHVGSCVCVFGICFSLVQLSLCLCPGRALQVQMSVTE